jgi:hypothetical protein
MITSRINLSSNEVSQHQPPQNLIGIGSIVSLTIGVGETLAAGRETLSVGCAGFRDAPCEGPLGLVPVCGVLVPLGVVVAAGLAPAVPCCPFGVGPVLVAVAGVAVAVAVAAGDGDGEHSASANIFTICGFCSKALSVGQGVGGQILKSIHARNIAIKM